MKYSFLTNARKSIFLFGLVMMAAYSAALAADVPVAPFSFGGSAASDSSMWSQLMKYKLWATGSKGNNAITLYDDVHVTDSVGFVGSAKGNMLLKNNGHEIGGPLLFGGDFHNETGDDHILTGPSHFGGGFYVAENGCYNNEFYGKNCAQAGTGYYFDARVHGETTCDSVPDVDVNLFVPNVNLTSHKYDLTLGNVGADNNNYFIDVPPGDKVFDVKISSLSMSNSGDIYVRMPPLGRPTRIVVENSFKLANNTSVYVVYADNDNQWNGSRWSTPIEHRASNLDYRGDLLFYFPNSMEIASGKKNMQGTYITKGHIDIAQDASFAGQLIAQDYINIQAHFKADQFRYVPFNPSILDAKALASGVLHEGMGEEALAVVLNQPSSSPVSFKYCFAFARDAEAYKDQKKSGTSGSVTTPASGSDLVTKNVPMCKSDNSVFGTAEFVENGTTLKNAIKLTAYDDTIPENKEYFYIRILDIEGGLLEGGTRSGDFPLYIEDNDDEVTGTDTTIVPDIKTVEGGRLDSIGFEDVRFSIESFPTYYRASGYNSAGVMKETLTPMDTYKVKIVSVPAKGSFKLGSSAVKVGDVISSTDITSGLLTYQSAADDFGDASDDPPYFYSSFKYKIVDPFGVESKDSYTVSILMLPANDKPVFDKTNMIYDAIVLTVDENSPVGTAVGAVFATDIDMKTDADASITYSMDVVVPSKGAENVFEVNPATGAITVKTAALDYETQTYYELRLIATDNGVAIDRDHVLKDTVKVIVNVVDKNDPPEIIPNPNVVAISVREHAPKDSILVEYKGRDDDNGQLLYFTFESADAKIKTADLPFEMVALANKDSAYLKVKSLDFETQPTTYAMRVIVADNADPAKAAFDTTNLTVTVLDMNETPYFAEKSFSYKITEKYVGEQSVGTVKALDYDTKATPATAFTFVLGDVYDVTDPANKVKKTGVFEINASTGEIIVSSAFGTGEMGDAYAGHSFEATVTVTDNGSKQNFSVNKKNLSATVDVSIQIDNINDPPKFDKDVYEFNIAEHSSVGTIVNSIAATDDDSGDKLTFSMDGSSVPFKLVANGDRKVDVVLKDSVLNYETKTSYQFKVKVSDGDLESEATVKINVQDVNETPYFDKNSYPFAINEKYKGGESVGSVSASDLDTKATPATVLTFKLGEVYDVTDPQNKTKVAGELFVINASTGEITISSSFGTNVLGTAYAGHSYETTVTVTDNGSKQNFVANKKDLSSTVNVYIQVKDENDPPKFDEDVYTLSIVEHSSAGAIVGNIEAIDVDAADKLSFSIVLVGTDPLPFKLVPNGDRKVDVVVKDSVLDYETKTSYEFKLTVTDGLESAETTVKVSVKDVNEKPTIAANAKSVKITEKYIGGQKVATASATDPDTKATPKTVFTYSLGTVYDVTDPKNKAKVSDVFEVSTSGTVSTSSKFGANSMGAAYAGHTYEVMVIVADNGSKQNFAANKVDLYDTLVITVYVSNVNDPPKFDKDVYTFEVAENSPAGTIVDQIVATDIDVGDDMVIRIVPLDSDPLPFELDSIVPGKVRVVVKDSVLNFEAKSSYEFKVTVSDDSLAVGEATVKINIKDVNEKPSIVRGELDIDENSVAGTSVGIVKVEDVDTWTKMNYALLDSTTGASKLFSIKAATSCDPGFYCGEVFLNSATLNFEQDSVYFVKVVATDNGKDAGFPPSLSDTVLFKIHVNDRNDPPKFPIRTATAEVDENSLQDVFVGQFTASDEDNSISMQDQLEYSLIEVSPNSAKYFQIDSRSGEITVALDSVLDYESVAVYTVKVRVTDNNGPESADTLVLTINVKDVNEEPTVAQQFFNIDERVAKGSVVQGGSVVAGDLDTASAFMKHKFFAIEGDTALFAIDSISGQFRTKARLPSYDSARSYSVKVRVVDYSVPGEILFADEVMVISVNDINDPPRIVTDTLRVYENSTVGTFVGLIEATDDEDLPSQLFYELISTSSEFEMTPQGNVFVKKGADLDYETKTSYTIEVRVSDRKDASATKKIVVMVDNENEAPHIADTTFVVVENAPAATLVGKLVASDDEDPAHKLVFGIIGSSDEFDVQSTGRIVVKKGANLDYEKKTSYEIEVFVMDLDSSVTTAKVTINIKDLNEAPVIEKEDFHVPENSPEKTVVGVVVAHDAEDPDSALIFTLVEPSNEFVLSKTGTISVKKGAVLDYENTKTYTIKVAVTDSQGASSTASLRINVDDIREIPTIEDTTFVIREDAKKGSIVGKIDIDNPEKDVAKVHLVGKSKVFKVAEDGTISLIDTLDYESKKEYELVLTVEGDDGSLDTAHVKVKVQNVIEIPDVVITRVSNDDTAWVKPDTVYTNSKELEFEWTANGKYQPDTLVRFPKDSTYIVALCYEDPSMDKPGCDTVVVSVSNAIPKVSITKTAEDTAAISGVTIVEQVDEKDTNFYVNHEMNEVRIHIKDKAAGVDTSFNVDLKLDSLLNIKPSLNEIKKVSKKNSITMDDAENATTTKTLVNDKTIAVSFTKKVDAVPVTVTYYTDKKGKVVKNEDGDVIMTVSYETTVNGKTVTVSYNVNGETGELVKDENGGAYQYSYEHEDEFGGLVGVNYKVDENGEIIKNEEGNYGYQVSYTYKNIYGNVSTKNIFVVVDKVVPVVMITSPENKAYVHTRGVKVEWTVDGVVQDTLTIQGLMVGLNTVVRTYRDKAGNEGSATILVYMNNPKELSVHLVEPVTIVNEDSVRKYYDINPPKDGESFAVSVYNYREGKEVETLTGGTYGKKKGSSEEPYPGMDGGHLGPTLVFNAVVPRCGDNPAAGLCTLDDLVESDGLISLEAGGGWDRKKVTVEEYVENYCNESFRKEYKGDMKTANLFNMKMKIKIWLYTNLGGFLDEYSFTQELNDPDIMDDVGQTQLFFEVKPDINGNLTSSDGRLLGTGAYVFKSEVNTSAELRCQLPNEAIGHRRKVSDELLKPFGYKRPNTTKKSSSKASSKKSSKK